ncbi:hypothetical protein HDU79_005629 [Rhizoclosmatium sp. JEL0117]|nr:hypothetical protein HDU79_005629 [Rhizoclosmatium sp. JEL0117]
MLQTLPPELLLLIASFVSPDTASLVRLGATCRRVTAFVSADSHVWRRLVSNLGFPLPPSLITPKTVAVLLASTHCDSCAKRTKDVSWRLLRKLCHKCLRVHTQIPPTLTRNPSQEQPLSDTPFNEWVYAMVLTVALKEREKSESAAATKAAKRATLITRFAALPLSPVSPDLSIPSLLDQCPSFKHIWSSRPTTVSPRVFSNASAILLPQLLQVRINAFALELFDTSCRQVFAEPFLAWMPIPRWYTNKYMLYLAQSKTVFQNFLVWEVFKDMAWNDPFPLVDLTPAIEKLEENLTVPLRAFEFQKRALVAKYPRMERVMMHFESNCITLIRDLFTEFPVLPSPSTLTPLPTAALPTPNTANQSLQTPPSSPSRPTDETLDLSQLPQPTTIKEKFETLFSEYVIKLRLLRLFPSCQACWLQPQLRNPGVRRLYVVQAGVIAWYLKFPSYFDFRDDIWHTNYKAIERSAHRWIRDVVQTSV